MNYFFKFNLTVILIGTHHFSEGEAFLAVYNAEDPQLSRYHCYWQLGLRDKAGY